jgi:SAM-dependent methyltransferase
LITISKYLSIEDRRSFSNTLLNVTILLFLLRSSIPAFKYPFIILYFGFWSYLLILIRNNFFSKAKYFIKYFILIISLIVVYFLAALFSDKIYLEVFKDSINILVLLSFFFFLVFKIDSHRELKLLLSNLIDCIIWFSIIISLFGLYEYFHVYFSNSFILLRESANVDYNFALLPVFFGMISVLVKLSQTRLRKEIIVYNLFLLIQSLQVFFSNSRRGFILISFIIIFLVLIFALSLFYKKNNLSAFVKSYTYYLISIVLFFLCLFFFVFATSYSFKLRAFKFTGVQRTYIFQQDLSQRVFRYYSIFEKETSYSSFYNKVWSPAYDAKDPDSGWGTRIHKTIFPLTGENVEIVPADAKGYLMDSTCNPYVENGNTYSYTELYLFNQKIKENDTVNLSVYCYVSKDFNGDWALINLINNGAWIAYTNYNFERKGTWQKLCISERCKKGEISGSLFFSKYKVTDFSSLRGHVIYAYPECKIISNRNKNDFISNFLIPKQITGSENWMPDVVTFQDEIISGAFNPVLFLKALSVQDKDPVRKWAYQFVSEDTTYHGYKSNISVDTIKNAFFDMRFIRWQFALQIFTKEFSWSQKVFGGGFNFLNWYGYYFLKDKTKTDYPHNPFLHVLLYSGILGLIIYSFFLYKVFYYYIKYRKEYTLLFIFFLITFYFAFFSAGNPFDPPIMGFFSILPFFIHAVHIKEKPGENNLINSDTGILFWDKYASEFDAIYGTKNTIINNLINQWFRKTMKIRFDKTIAAIPDGNLSVLDIGCGPGHYCFSLAKSGKREILGIDFSGAMIGLAKIHAGELGIENKLDFREVNCMEFNPGRKFDYCIMMGFIEYFEDPVSILNKALTLSDRRLFISFPAAGGILAFQRKLRYRNRCYLRLYTRADIENLMTDLNISSFTIEKIQRDFFVTINLK